MPDVLQFPDLDFAINSREDLEKALGELGYLDAKEQHIKAKFKRASIELAAQYDELLKVEIDGAPVSIEKRRAEVSKAVESWCNANRAELLTGDKKSLAMTTGTIGWRKQKDTLEPAGGSDEKTWLQKAVDAVLGKLLACLQKISLHGIKADKLLSIEVKWNKRRILDDLECKQIDPKDLKKVGFVFVPGQDAFYCTPTEQHLGVESRAA